ncbi:TVP38/TMEM64 family protein [Paenibacillus gansuensis]|uniref:TVP38/TMEM64 family membrane protein n=1 Tax=Paenibacillus gansuensis TaxID=306542 RepID=A0ABW5PF45_9BACL
MDWLQHVSNLNMDDFQRLMDDYKAFGPLPGIALPFVEAFLPFLPLWVFIVGNAAAYGLTLGFLYSYIGSIAGSFLLFWIFRRFGHRLRGFVDRKLPHTRKFFVWVEHKGFTPIFLLCCFPFTPSFLLVVVAGLSTVSIRTFAMAVLSGKAVMIFVIAFLGHDIPSLIRHPWQLVIVCAVIAGLWYGGKKLEAKYKLEG